MSKYKSHFRLTEKDVIEYVKETLDIFHKNANLEASEIGDGNINYVFKVRDIDTNKSIVIKQADTLLRSSGRPLDVDRNRIEAEVLMMEYEFSGGLTPKIYNYDPIMCTIVMEDISDHKNLRLALLDNEIYPKFADHISSFVVNTLLPTTDLVMDSGEKKDRVARYINKDLCKISEDLVFTEPYIDYKGRNVILEENMDFIIENIYKDRKLVLEAGKLKNNFMNNAQALIHGDLHSGSIFLNKESTKVLDPEFAFYGPIGYDLGNVVGNLFFALANAYITKGVDEVSEFISWLEEAIVDVVNLSKTKFYALYKEIVTDTMAKEKEYMDWYIDSIFSDTAGSAGLEIIRRVVGDSKVLDITSIEDIESRVKVERILINSAKEFIKNRESIKSGEDYMRIFKSNL